MTLPNLIKVSAVAGAWGEEKHIDCQCHGLCWSTSQRSEAGTKRSVMMIIVALQSHFSPPKPCLLFVVGICFLRDTIRITSWNSSKLCKTNRLLSNQVEVCSYDNNAFKAIAIKTWCTHLHFVFQVEKCTQWQMCLCLLEILAESWVPCTSSSFHPVAGRLL